MRDEHPLPPAAGVAQAALRIRPADAADMAAIQAIYAHHVLTGLASFEEMPPAVAEMAARRQKVIGRGLPYLVAEDVPGGGVLGYAYASPFRDRVAYRFSLEDSVYVAPAAVGRGVGSALLAELIARCSELGYRQMVAVIGDSANAASIGLHAKLGFEMAGRLASIAFKFGRWVDSVYMRRPLGPGDDTLPAAPG
ncbi:GNAT family N-acetyltransferase [Shumkonia mesophila]|uniref:GNAT family N-acetyltransferase n=1 Tax=Shumkonia mesophila TaxID=2838854 RepID=UPI0029345417|nr:N-acetyltransferase family protein [Shumkonia mesophila]